MRFSALLLKVVDFLEKKLRIDLRYTLSGGFFLSLTQVASAIAGLLLTIAFANLLPIDTYGTYRYILAVYSLLAIATLPGIDVAVQQSVARGLDGSFAIGVKSKLRFSILGTFASFLYATYLFMQGSTVMGNIFIVMGLALPLMESFSLYSSYLNAKKLFKISALLDVITQAVSISALILTMFLTKNIIALVIAYFVPFIIIRTLATWYVIRTHVHTGESDPELHAYGRVMTIYQILTRIIASADQIVLYHFLGPAQVAIFSLATAIPNRVQSLFRITGTLSFPKFANRSGAEIAKTLPRKMFIFSLGVLGVCGVYVICAPFLFAHIFPKYLPSLAYSQAAIFFTLSAITYPFGSYLTAHKKVRETYLMAIVSFIAKIFCLIFLVPLFGVWGAVIGVLATAGSSMLLAFYFIFQERRKS